MQRLEREKNDAGLKSNMIIEEAIPKILADKKEIILLIQEQAASDIKKAEVDAAEAVDRADGEAKVHAQTSSERGEELAKMSY